MKIMKWKNDNDVMKNDNNSINVIINENDVLMIVMMKW